MKKIEKRHVVVTIPPPEEGIAGKPIVRLPNVQLWVYEVLPGLLQSGEPEGNDWDLIWNVASTVVGVGGDNPPRDIPRGRMYIRWFFEDHEIYPDRSHELARFIAGLVDNGETVLVHCAAGMNRSGFINALVVRELLGCSGEIAMVTVQSSRPGALQTTSYVKYLADLPEKPDELDDQATGASADIMNRTEAPRFASAGDIS